jgi:O-antigen ligase
VAVVALVVMLSIPQVRQMIALRLGSDGLQTYDGDRFSTQTKALEMAIEQPFGIGPGQAEIAFDYSTHSTYLRLLSENGPLALSAFVALLALTLLRSIHGARTLKNNNWRIVMAITSASLAGYIVNSFVIDTVHWRHIWLFLALPWANHPDMQRIETAKG